MNPLLRLLPVAFRVGGRLAPDLTGRAAWRLFTTPRPGPRPLSETQQRLLAEAEALDVLHEGRRLAVYRWLPDASGEGAASGGARVVLLAHGWADRAVVFEALIAALRRAGFIVVAFDGPAHGASEGRRTHLPDFAGALQVVARAAGPIYGIVGHSFGAGAASMAVAGVPPLAASTSTERLVLVGGPNRLRDVIARFVALVQLPERAVAVMHEEVRRLSDRPVDALSVASILDGARVPLLVVHDRQDREIPFADGEAVAAAVPGARFQPTDGLGHRRLLRSPDVVDAIRSFLAQDAPIARSSAAGWPDSQPHPHPPALQRPQ